MLALLLSNVFQHSAPYVDDPRLFWNMEMDNGSRKTATFTGFNVSVLVKIFLLFAFLSLFFSIVFLLLWAGLLTVMVKIFVLFAFLSLFFSIMTCALSLFLNQVISHG